MTAGAPARAHRIGDSEGASAPGGVHWGRRHPPLRQEGGGSGGGKLNTRRDGERKDKYERGKEKINTRRGRTG